MTFNFFHDFENNKRFSRIFTNNTGEETILLKKKPGDTVNLECDLIGKYVEKLLFGKAEETQKSSGGITEAFLAENGFM